MMDQLMNGSNGAGRVAAAATLIDPEELVGFDLTDGAHDLGEIEEVINLRGRSYYLVAAQHWTFGAKRLLPVSAVSHIDADERVVSTSAEVELIRAAPDFDPFHLLDDGYITDVEQHYGLGPIDP